MMIYSVVPPEVILSDIDGEPHATDAVPLAHGGTAVVLVRRLPGHGTVIERVISTDPRHYLDPTLAPGRPWSDQRPTRS